MDEDREDQDRAITVLTCKGDVSDPCFPARLHHIVCNLHRLVDDGRGRGGGLEVTKVEPWNSVRVTFSIPKNCAQKLRRLAEAKDNSLRDLGILSVQVEGDQVITLTLANSPAITTLPTPVVVSSNVSSITTVNGEDNIPSTSSSSVNSLPSSTTILPLISATQKSVDAQIALPSYSDSTRVRVAEEAEHTDPLRVCTVNVAQYSTSGRKSPQSSSLSSSPSLPVTRSDLLVTRSNIQNNTYEISPQSLSPPSDSSEAQQQPHRKTSSNLVRQEVVNDLTTSVTVPPLPMVNKTANLSKDTERSLLTRHVSRSDKHNHGEHKNLLRTLMSTKEQETISTPPLLVHHSSVNCSESSDLIREDGPSEDSPTMNDHQNSLFKSVIVEDPVNRRNRETNSLDKSNGSYSDNPEQRFITLTHGTSLINPSPVRLRKDDFKDHDMCLHDGEDPASVLNVQQNKIVSSRSSCNNNNSPLSEVHHPSRTSLQSDEPVSPELTSPLVQSVLPVDSNNEVTTVEALNHHDSSDVTEGDTLSGDGHVLSRDSLLSDSPTSLESKSDSREEDVRGNCVSVSILVSTSRSSSVDESLSMSSEACSRQNSASSSLVNFVNKNSSQNHNLLNFSRTNCVSSPSSVVQPVTTVPHPPPAGNSINSTSLVVASSDEESSEPLMPSENINGTHSNDTDPVPRETDGLRFVPTLNPASQKTNNSRSRVRRKSSPPNDNKKTKYREVHHSVASGDHNYICVTKDDHHNSRNHSLTHPQDVDGFDEEIADAIVGRYSDLNNRPNKRRKVSGS